MTVLGAITLLVRDYEEAIDWFVGKLGFELREDRALEGEKRWIRIAAPRGGSEMLFARAVGAEQKAAVGRAAGGRVAFFLHTDDFDGDFARMQSAGVEFLEAPRIEAYGKVVVFADLLGNKWDLVQAA